MIAGATDAFLLTKGFRLEMIFELAIFVAWDSCGFGPLSEYGAYMSWGPSVLPFDGQTIEKAFLSKWTPCGTE